MNREKDEDYAFWSDINPNRQWTQITEAAVLNSSLLDSYPQDIKNFCPQYSSLNKNQKTKFWTYLISIIANYESRFDNQTQYKEKFKDSNGQFVISRGLMQLSFESAQQKNYACEFDKANDLHLARTNLTCAVNILAYWVNKDQIISGVGKDILGGGRYWSVLRPSHPKFNIIQNQSKTIKICQH